MDPHHMDVQVLDDQLELIYDSSVQTQDIISRTCRMRWMIETNGERQSQGNPC